MIITKEDSPCYHTGMNEAAEGHYSDGVKILTTGEPRFKPQQSHNNDFRNGSHCHPPPLGFIM